MLEGEHDSFPDGLALMVGNTTTSDNAWETIKLTRVLRFTHTVILIVYVFSKTKDADVQKALLDLRECGPELRIAISELFACSWTS